MATQLPYDLFWLALSALCMSVLWLPHHIYLLKQNGWRGTLWNPGHEMLPGAGWASRAKRAQRNAARHFALFAIVALIAHIAGMDPTILGHFILLWLSSRLAHFASYMMGIPTLPQILFISNIAIMFWLAAILLIPGF